MGIFYRTRQHCTSDSHFRLTQLSFPVMAWHFVGDHTILATLVASQETSYLSTNNHLNLMTLFIFIGVMASVCISMRIYNRYRKTEMVEEEPQAQAGYMYRTLLKIELLAGKNQFKHRKIQKQH